MKKLKVLVLLFPLYASAFAQQVPAIEQNFPYLVTFGNKADKSWGDDDFVQTFFFSIPVSCNSAIYIRVFDPDIGGFADENRGGFNTKTRFTIYGGKGAHSTPDAKKQDPIGNFRSGVQMATKTFGNEETYNNAWYTFGPFSPIEGELQPEYGGYIFKIIIEGLEGDDGNLYKMYLSSKQNENIDIEGGNSFTYEFSLRLPDQVGSICHLYPFVTSNVIAVKTSVFDYDRDGMIRTVSVAKKGEVFRTAGNDVWVDTTHAVVPEEYNTSLDIQFVKQYAVKNNNICVFITNQYGELLPFYTVPIGGVPKYKYRVGVEPRK
ncbi:MAG TPA: hypothetical protein VI731_06580 [Bacteroidia bacterium]|nr:hypothetical protein [Bacteroidia bacterium]